MKILNIDAFAKTDRQIVFGGKTYPVEDPNVQQFIDNLKAAEDLEAEGKSEEKQSISKSFENAVIAISQSIPTMDITLIRSLKLPAITAILEFIRGEGAASAGESTSEGTPAEKKQV